jgi:hypothetical protein
MSSIWNTTPDLLRSGLGAIIGFALAQTVNIAKVAGEWLVRPRLRIEAIDKDSWRILTHHAEAANGETYEEETYGFYVRNAGRRIATGVRFQLMKIEYRGKNFPHFVDRSLQTHDLSVYNQFGDGRGASAITLVPNARAIVHLGTWREDSSVIFPAVASIPDYYEESCQGADEFRFTVVAFDDKARFITALARIRAGGRGEMEQRRYDDFPMVT